MTDASPVPTSEVGELAALYEDMEDAEPKPFKQMMIRLVFSPEP
jgi:hypothetical protein